MRRYALQLFALLAVLLLALVAVYVFFPGVMTGVVQYVTREREAELKARFLAVYSHDDFSAWVNDVISDSKLIDCSALSVPDRFLLRGVSYVTKRIVVLNNRAFAVIVIEFGGGERHYGVIIGTNGQQIEHLNSSPR